MRTRVVVALVAVFALAAAASAQKEANPLADVKWLEGPAAGDLGGLAEVRVPAGYAFAGADDTRKLMEAMQNPVGGHELGFLMEKGKDWFIVFEFDETGYIRDDEKANLDADAMLSRSARGRRRPTRNGRSGDGRR